MQKLTRLPWGIGLYVLIISVLIARDNSLALYGAEEAGVLQYTGVLIGALLGVFLWALPFTLLAYYAPPKGGINFKLSWLQMAAIVGTVIAIKFL